MASNRIRRSRAGFLAVVTAAALVSGLAACSAPAADKPKSSASRSASPTPTAEPDPVLDPSGDSEANLAYFDLVNRRLLATVPTPNGQQLVENLVTAGFVKADMELTPDTTVGSEAAEAILFSVRIN